MRRKLLIIFWIGIWFSQNPNWAQTRLQRTRILQSSDLPSLRSKNNPHLIQFRAQRERGATFSRNHRLPLKVRNRNGSFSHFSRIDEKGNLIYLKPYNNTDAARTIGVNSLYDGGSLGLDLSGKNMVVGMWDAGRVRETHELLSGKVEQEDNAQQYDDHSTQVAGTLVGKKLNSPIGSRAQGMAYEAHLEAYDWEDDLEEMYSAAAKGLLISNHSYGADLEMIRNPQNILGSYDQLSAAVDNLMFSAPYYLVVNAAGNDRDIYQRINPADGGYNLLAGQMSTAKNALVVSAVYNVPDYQGPSSVQMSEFSSWGPTNDNRIKPDIAADGMFILSSVANNLSGRPANNLYDFYSGTSAASPSVSGGILLLQELSSRLNQGEFLKSATLRAIITSTAKPAGDHLGPDPKFGWGLLDVAAAAKVILDNNLRKNSFYEELTLSDQIPYKQKIKATGDQQIRVSVAWTDPEGEAQKAGEKTPVLINDLDVRVTDEKGKEFFPWHLDPHDFSAPALNDGDNAVDNIEQIWIPNAVEGESYEIHITHKKQLKGGKQDFSLVVLGGVQERAAALDSELFIAYPNPGKDVLYLDFKTAQSDFDIYLFDLLGRRVMAKRHHGKSTAQYVLDISNLATGSYLLQVRTSNGKKTTQIIVR